MTFASADDVWELARLGGAITNPESGQMLEDAIINGHGGVYQSHAGTVWTLETALEVGRPTS